MDVIHKGGLKFDLSSGRPRLTVEMYEWLMDNDIRYDMEEDKYGPGDCHSFLFIHFKNETDAVAFKLRWV